MVASALNIAAAQVLEYQAYGQTLERDGNQGQDAPHNLTWQTTPMQPGSATFG